MNFDQDERRWLASLADVLIPAGDDRPAASQAGVAEQGLDLVLAARPDLAAGLKDLLHKARYPEGQDHQAEGRPAEEVVADLQENDPAAFAVLAEVVPGAYFLNPEVRQAIGYTGQSPRAIDPRCDYLEDGLLESVLRRGPIYRPTPDRL